jgi:hypothetical protein
MSKVSRNKLTYCSASAGAMPEYTARCQSSEGPEIRGGPEYGSARSCNLCTVIRRSDRSGASKFRGTVVTDTGVVMEFQRLAQTTVRSSGVLRHDCDTVLSWLRALHPSPFYQQAMKSGVLPKWPKHFNDDATCIKPAMIDMDNISDAYDLLERVLPQKEKPRWPIKCQIASELNRRRKGIKTLQGHQVSSIGLLLSQRLSCSHSILDVGRAYCREAVSQHMSSWDIVVVVFSEPEHDEPKKNDKKIVGDIIEAYVLRVNSPGDYAWVTNPKFSVAEFLLNTVDRDIEVNTTCLNSRRGRDVRKAESGVASRSDGFRRRVVVGINSRVRTRVQVDWRERKTEAKNIYELFCVGVDVRHGCRGR